MTKHAENEELRTAQKALAAEVISLVHGKQTLQEVVCSTNSLFSLNKADFNQMSPNQIENSGQIIKF